MKRRGQRKAGAQRENTRPGQSAVGRRALRGTGKVMGKERTF